MNIVKEGSQVSNRHKDKNDEFDNLASHNKLFTFSNYYSDKNYQSQNAGRNVKIQKGHSDFGGLDKNKAEVKNNNVIIIIPRKTFVNLTTFLSTTQRIVIFGIL